MANKQTKIYEDDRIRIEKSSYVKGTILIEAIIKNTTTKSYVIIGQYAFVDTDKKIHQELTGDIAYKKAIDNLLVWVKDRLDK